MILKEFCVKVWDNSQSSFCFPNGDLVVVTAFVEKYFLMKYLSIFVRNKLATYEGKFSDEELNDIVFRIINEELYPIVLINDENQCVEII